MGRLKSPLVRREGRLPSWGAAGYRWLDIKSYSASHLAAALAGQKNSPWASSGLWTSCSVLTRPSGDPQPGPRLANEEGPPLQAGAAGSAHPSESAPPSRGEKNPESGIRSTGDRVLALLDLCLDVSEHVSSSLIFMSSGHWADEIGGDARRAAPFDLRAVDILDRIVLCGEGPPGAL